MDPSSSTSLVPYNSKRKRADNEAFDCCKRQKHDVFLSYSNEDIGKSFISHLKGALNRNGFDISDNNTLPVGQEESSELLKAIEESWIYVVVFSNKYLFSVSCLDELILIMDSVSKFEKRKVFPIFYKVHPFYVRGQQYDSFREAFGGHRVDDERVEKWIHVLQVVGNLVGEHLTWENEEEFVRKIVKMVGKVKLPLELFDAEHPVGIQPRAQDLISELRLDDDDPSITAVIGMSGSGKTTLVKAVFDTIVTNFDASCFIENTRYYKHNGPNWKVVLQHDVISRFTGDDYRIHNVVAAKARNFVNSQKVLLVLDGVDKYEQLQALGVHNCASFGCGSRIIVTTTNKQSLSGLQKYTSYEISLLERSESFKLFVRVAYGKDELVDEEFVDEIVDRAGGVPLVLEVWGRYFKSHESIQWPRLMEKLRRIPHEDVQEKLRVSYDSLSHQRAKDLFLDIACFFDGMAKDEVTKVLEDEENAFFPDIEIQHLIDKGLIQGDYFLNMHDVIREMGREVVRQENEYHPGQRSRLVHENDVVPVLRDCSGSDSVRSIYLDSDEDDCLDEDVISVQIEAFRKMSNLRFIKLLYNDGYKLQWSCSDDELSSPLCFKHLKYLECSRGFPLRCMDNIEMGNVVVIKLQESNLETLWEGALKGLKKLRILDVSWSRYLIWTGSFIGLENLEELYLNGCENLKELDTSIGCLQKLRVLILSGCIVLKRVPWEMIGKLTSLGSLDLGNCPKIWDITDELGNLKSVEQLYFLSIRLESIPDFPPNIEEVEAQDCRSLESLSPNMPELQFLTELVLDNCKELGSQGFVKVTGLRNLQRLYMRNCNVSQVSSEIENLVSLQYLYLSENTFTSLPDSMSNLSQLEHLEIKDCHKLKLLPLLPSNLRHIEARGCELLDVMPYDKRQKGYTFPSNMSDLRFLKNLFLDNSKQLGSQGLAKVTGLRNLGILYMSSCNVSQVCSEIGNLVSLHYLDLSKNTFTSLPDTLSNLSRLKDLVINDCQKLKLLPLLPSKLRKIAAIGCESLDVMPFDSTQKGYIFHSHWCRNMQLVNSQQHDPSELIIRLSGKEEVVIPEWCSYKSINGQELSFVAPPLVTTTQHLDQKKICGVIFYCNTDCASSLRITMLNNTKGTRHRFMCGTTGPALMGLYPLNDGTIVVEAGDTLVIQYHEGLVEVKSFGLRLIYEDDVVDDSTFVFSSSSCIY